MMTSRLTTTLVFLFSAVNFAILPTTSLAAYYGLDGQVTQEQRQLADNEETLEKLQDLLYQAGANENSVYADTNWQPEPLVITEDEAWPKDDAAIKHAGQVAGLSTCPEGKLHLFHRGPVVWDVDSFSVNNTYTAVAKGPIKNDTVLVLNPETGALIKSWGAKRFYMPHGITIDAQGNIWLTDVALHQVFRFKHDNLHEPNLVLGEAFVPGSDAGHFCKPTDVAVSSTGMVYISDGYCNSRVLIADASGKVIGAIAIEEGLVVPHSLALLEKDDLICVADRENKRILCYTAGLTEAEPGKLAFNVAHAALGRVFAIDHVGDVMLAVNGPDLDDPTPNGLSLDLATERLVNVWAPKSGFSDPHDLTVAPDNSAFFVSDIGSKSQKKVYKFKLGV